MEETRLRGRSLCGVVPSPSVLAALTEPLPGSPTCQHRYFQPPKGQSRYGPFGSGTEQQKTCHCFQPDMVAAMWWTGCGGSPNFVADDELMLVFCGFISVAMTPPPAHNGPLTEHFSRHNDVGCHVCACDAHGLLLGTTIMLFASN